MVITISIRKTWFSFFFSFLVFFVVNEVVCFARPFKWLLLFVGTIVNSFSFLFCDLGYYFVVTFAVDIFLFLFFAFFAGISFGCFYCSIQIVVSAAFVANISIIILTQTSSLQTSS